MPFKNTLFVILACLLQVSRVYTQSALSPAEVRSEIRLTPTASYGFILPHHPEMKVFSNRHFSLFELSLSRVTAGSLPWHHAYGFPETGVAYLYSDLGNTGILGSVNALCPYVDFPLIKGEEARLGFRFGAGLGWFSRTFHPFDNYKNTAIGSHLNAIIAMKILGEFRLNAYTGLRAGFSFIHFSNGSTRVPNYGINICALEGGVAVSLRRGSPLPYEAPLPEVKFHPEYHFVLSAGVKEIFPVGGEMYPVFNLAVTALSPVNRHFIAGIGVDIGYDQSDEEILQRKGIPFSGPEEVVKYAANAAGGIRMGKLDVCLHAGVYLYQKENSEGSIYDKIVVNYAFSKHWLLNLTLKTHFARADFIAGGLGYKL